MCFIPFYFSLPAILRENWRSAIYYLNGGVNWNVVIYMLQLLWHLGKWCFLNLMLCRCSNGRCIIITIVKVLLEFLSHFPQVRVHRFFVIIVHQHRLRTLYGKIVQVTYSVWGLNISFSANLKSMQNIFLAAVRQVFTNSTSTWAPLKNLQTEWLNKPND